MATTERAKDAIVHPPIPLTEGQKLGFQGLPIPPEVAKNYQRYHELGGVHQLIEFDAAEGIVEAKWTITGYTDGLTDFLREHPSVRTSLIREDGTVISPVLLTVPANIDAYIDAYNFQRPAVLAERTDANGARRADAGALGFVVAATKLGVDVDRVPANDFEWAAFQYGMTATADKKDRGFYELLIKVEADPATSERLIKMNVQGREIKAAMQRAAANPA